MGKVRVHLIVCVEKGVAAIPPTAVKEILPELWIYRIFVCSWHSRGLAATRAGNEEELKERREDHERGYGDEEGEGEESENFFYWQASHY